MSKHITVLLQLIIFLVITTNIAYSSNVCLQHYEKHIQYHDVNLDKGYANFDNCNIGDDDIPLLLSLIHKNNNNDIVKLNLKNNQISNKGAILLSEYKSGYPIYFDLSHNQIGVEGIMAFANSKSYINGLDFRDNPIDKDGVNEFIEKLSPSIAFLALNNVDIKPESMAIFSKNRSPYGIYNVYSLSLENCNLNDESLSYIAKLRINYLTLSNNKFTNKGLSELHSNAYAGNNAYVDLSNNKIDDEGAIIISENLKEVGWIVLNDNFIGNKGLAALSSIQNDIRLSLNNNNIDDEGAYILSKNTFLYGVDLENNKITSKGLMYLLNNITLRDIDLGFNQLNDDAAFLLAKSTHLKFAFLSHNAITDKGAAILATNTSIQYLGLDYNLIGDSGALAFVNNSTLKSLDLSHNHISKQAIEELISRASIKHIKTDGNMLVQR